jgi:hypothetical protein
MKRYVVLNNLNDIIAENNYYRDPDGNQYGPDFPKNGLSGLSPITETKEPELNRITDPAYDPEHPEINPAYHSDWVLFNPELQTYSGSIELLNGIYTQIWAIRDFTAEELAAVAAAWLAELRASQPAPVEPTAIDAPLMAGANKPGYTTTVSAGNSTGSGSSRLELRTAKGGRSGTRQNPPTASLTVDGDAFGFGVEPAPRRAITGSTGGNAVLAQIAAALHTHGIIIDNTTN